MHIRPVAEENGKIRWWSTLKIREATAPSFLLPMYQAKHLCLCYKYYLSLLLKLLFKNWSWHNCNSFIHLMRGVSYKSPAQLIKHNCSCMLSIKSLTQSHPSVSDPTKCEGIHLYYWWIKFLCVMCYHHCTWIIPIQNSNEFPQIKQENQINNLLWHILEVAQQMYYQHSELSRDFVDSWSNQAT